jgi:MFS family permease
VVLTGVAGGGAALLLIGLGPSALALPGLFAAGFCTGMANPMIFSIGQTLSGPLAGGRWMGIQNMLGNCAGILAPIATGFIVAATGSFTGAFVLAAILSVLGLVCWGVVLVRVEPVAWRRPAAELQAAGL